MELSSCNLLMYEHVNRTIPRRWCPEDNAYKGKDVYGCMMCLFSLIVSSLLCSKVTFTTTKSLYLEWSRIKKKWCKNVTLSIYVLHHWLTMDINNLFLEGNWRIFLKIQEFFLIFEIKSWKLNNYSIDMCWSYFLH